MGQRITQQWQKRLYVLLIILSVLASLKMIFFSLGMDEEYQLVMAYRNVHGDRLFLDMWEPHQSSAFLCSILMRPWLALFSTTGVVLYLRLCGTLLHLGISFYLYRILKDFMDVKYAWLLALIYYNTIPKQIILPEFGIMQVWCYTLLALFLTRYYTCDKKIRYLVLAALSLVLNVLSYPSCLILFPFLLILTARFSGSSKWRDMGIVTSVCVLCGLGYLGMLFTYTTPGELAATLSHILSGDVTHSLSPEKKLLSFLTGFLFMAALWGLCLALSVAVAKWKKLKWEQTCCLTAVFACLMEFFYWVVLGKGYETMHIHLATFALAGLCACGKSLSASGLENISSGTAIPSKEQMQRRFLKYIMAGAFLSLLAVVYLTDLTLAESVPHAMPAAFCGAVLLIFTLKKNIPKKDTCGKSTFQKEIPEKDNNTANSQWIYATLTVWCLTAVFGKGYTLRSGPEYNNVLQSGGIMREGPAIGIISNYMGAYVYNCDYEDWQAYIKDGDRVLIMVDQVMNLGTIRYLFKDVEISHFSIVNPTAYDERLLEYWEMYPEKYPNVIIVDCWYGQLMTDPEGWLMQYIENEFGYTQVNDGRYMRIYRK